MHFLSAQDLSAHELRSASRVLNIFCCSDLSEPSASSAGDELVDDDEDDEDIIDLVDEAPPEPTGQTTVLIMLCKSLCRVHAHANTCSV